MDYMQFYRPDDDHIQCSSEDTAEDEMPPLMVQPVTRQKKKEREERLKRAPNEKYCYKKIGKRLRTRILYQPTATTSMASLLTKVAVMRHIMDRAQEQQKKCPYKLAERIYVNLLAGPSGVGKTETVNHICHELGMDKGYVNERFKICVTGRSLGNATQDTAVAGAGAGYEGHQEKQSIADRLLAMLRPAKAKSAAKAKKAPPGFTSTERPPQPQEQPPPPYILLFIDEFDKANASFVSALAGLFDSGCISNTHGEEFELPDETILIILMASNFAAEAIGLMRPPHNCYAARGIVRDAMQEKGLAQDIIGRINGITIYFKPTREEFAIIMHQKLDAYMQQRGQLYMETLGELEFERHTKELVVNHILTTMYDSGGIRSGVRELFDNMDQLLSEALQELQSARMPALRRRQPNASTLATATTAANSRGGELPLPNLQSKVVGRLINIDDLNVRMRMNREDLRREHPELRTNAQIEKHIKNSVTRELCEIVGRNSSNMQMLGLYADQGEKQVKTLSLEHNGRPVNVNILPLVNVNVSVNVDFLSEKRVNERIDKLESKLDKIRDIAETNEKNAIYKIREVLDTPHDEFLSNHERPLSLTASTERKRKRDDSDDAQEDYESGSESEARVEEVMEAADGSPLTKECVRCGDIKPCSDFSGRHIACNKCRYFLQGKKTRIDK